MQPVDYQESLWEMKTALAVNSLCERDEGKRNACNESENRIDSAWASLWCNELRPSVLVSETQ